MRTSRTRVPAKPLPGAKARTTRTPLGSSVRVTAATGAGAGTDWDDGAEAGTAPATDFTSHENMGGGENGVRTATSPDDWQFAHALPWKK